MSIKFNFSDNTIGFLLQGKIDLYAIDELNHVIAEKLQKYQKINLYLEDDNITKFTLGSVYKQVAYKFANGSRFNKIALVTNRKWIRLFGNLDDILLKATVRSFPVEKRMDAMDWISEEEIQA